METTQDKVTILLEGSFDYYSDDFIGKATVGDEVEYHCGTPLSEIIEEVAGLCDKDFVITISFKKSEKEKLLAERLELTNI
jgi:hypothetical protein